ncbi:hypothetical protein QQW99_19475 [Bacillus amyloliquefaciens]|uniref:hypothetical protein n=1 Tax=Bacillus amyloliquefaciens TaxID=1390 RepID=UPI00255BC54A|nr:hypothetical protein [Bacillus amyloliquefaciens]WIX29270.1 hypothetical protein QQW99_19475 [Bacillus amyloliquefaciens]
MPRSAASSSIFIRANAAADSGATQREMARGASWFSNAQLGQPTPSCSGHLPIAAATVAGVIVGA